MLSKNICFASKSLENKNNNSEMISQWFKKSEPKIDHIGINKEAVKVNSVSTKFKDINDPKLIETTKIIKSVEEINRIYLEVRDPEILQLSEQIMARVSEIDKMKKKLAKESQEINGYTQTVPKQKKIEEIKNAAIDIGIGLFIGTAVSIFLAYVVNSSIYYTDMPIQRSIKIHQKN